MLQPKDIALAAQALNRIDGLSPATRRVGHELLQRMDRNTGLCWPSQERIAAALGLSDRSVRTAIAQLKALGFLTWKASRRATNVYCLAVKALAAAAERLKAALRSQPRQATHDEGRVWTKSSADNAEIKTGRFLPSIQPSVILPMEKKHSARLWERLQKLEPRILTAIIGTASENDLNTAAHFETLKSGTGIQHLLIKIQGANA